MFLAFTAPWAGPGNSEGGASQSEGALVAAAEPRRDIGAVDEPGSSFLVTTPWPGPGNSDG